IDSAEAYFATQPEKVEWTQLKSDEERKAFIDRYWLKRDPTPGTPRNEFRDVIMDRIVKADAKYKVDVTRGSETARGFALVVFGPPARFRAESSGSAGTVAQPSITGGTVEVGE